uniref:Uncharacterized protein n=1 Tax=Rhizophora mucronata TaxID=61149 RepID=A0A2P2LKM8_RHIMU
MCAKTKIST